MVSTSFTAAALAALAVASSVDAHGTLAKPGLKFTGTAYGGDFSSTIPMSALKPQAGDIFTHYPDWTANANAFGRAFKASQYKSLKEFILKNQDMSKGRKKNPSTAECGFTDPNGGAVQTLPDQLEWYGGQMNHPGPCEVWCDNEIVVPFTADCAATYPQGKIKYDKSKCAGKSRLTLYWMSTLLEWQVYIDCAKIGSGSQTPSSSGSSKPTTAPAPATAAKPNVAPAPPASKTSTAPAAKASTAPAPAPSATSKCKVRRG